MIPGVNEKWGLEKLENRAQVSGRGLTHEGEGLRFSSQLGSLSRYVGNGLYALAHVNG